MAAYGCDPEILRLFLVDSGLKYAQTGSSWVFTCPRCNSPKKLYFFKKNGRFKCFKCSEADSTFEGRPEYALAELLGRPVGELRARLYGGRDVPAAVFLDLPLKDFFGDDEEPEEVDDPLPITAWPLDFHPICHPYAVRGAAYLEGRGVPPEVADRYGVRYHPEGRAVAFPVESRGVLHGWQTRLVIPTEWVDEHGAARELLKSVTTGGLPRDRVLMFADRVTGAHALVGEGPMDAIKGDLVGGNVATLGKAVTRRQLELLRLGGVRRLYLGLDPDAAAEVQRIVRDRFDDFELYSLAIKRGGGPAKPDLGAMTFREVYELWSGAERVCAGRLFVYLDPRVHRGRR